MTDDVGLWEHALYKTPRTEHGYCTDDNARALVVMSRQPNPPPELLDLARTCFRFVCEAGDSPEGFHNRRDAEGTWIDVRGSDDSQGRALWGLGSVVNSGLPEKMRETSLELVIEKCALRSPSPRAHAFVVLGAAEVLAAIPDHPVALHALERSAGHIRPRLGSPWPWPEDRLAYDNARLPDALLAAGHVLSDSALVDSGLELLDWLVATETAERHFSFSPANGWSAGEPRPGFDQQPVEAAAMADACYRAWEMTAEPRWAERVLAAAAWFLGDNDTGAVIYDTRTGGGRDGLTSGGVNENQGAESTLAAVSTLQRASALNR